MLEVFRFSFGRQSYLRQVSYLAWLVVVGWKNSASRHMHPLRSWTRSSWCWQMPMSRKCTHSLMLNAAKALLSNVRAVILRTGFWGIPPQNPVLIIKAPTLVQGKMLSLLAHSASETTSVLRIAGRQRVATVFCRSSCFKPTRYTLSPKKT